MLEVALMMIMGKLQSISGKSWQWAIAFAVVDGLLSGFAPMIFVMRLLVSLLYFHLLDKFESNIPVYLAIYILFPLGLWGLAMGVA
ncbi:MAG: hypothetical protein Q4B71_00720 [Cardiobacteriaceae bacterium]|nr:hypothetical protein [Cardiobacteriaceae bacterium]